MTTQKPDMMQNQKPAKKYTIAEIKASNTAAGFYFFSRDTMKFFGDSLRFWGVRHVGGRVFIVRNCRQKNGPDNTGQAREFFPATGDIGVPMSDDEMIGAGLRDLPPQAEYPAFTRVVNPAWVRPWKEARRARMFCKIKWDGRKLSITGVIGPRPSGNAAGGCGQIAMGFWHRKPEHNDKRYSDPIRPEAMDFNDGWGRDTWLRFLEVWHDFHLNETQAACEHQRALGWTYATHEGQKCPVCGYGIGTAWKTAPVPADVLEFLHTLPETAVQPAWV